MSRAAALLVMLLAAGAGCSSGGGDAPRSEAEAPEPAPGRAEPAEPAGAPSPSASPAAPAAAKPAGPAPRPASPGLEAARRAAALGAMETLPRLRLAKTLHDAGERLLAFAVAEHVGQEQPPDFLVAFHHVFRGGPADLGEEAEAGLRRAAAAAPEDPEPLEALADLYLWRRDFAEAARVLEEAAALAPGDFSLHANLSQSLMALGEAERAAQVLESWYDGHPEAPQAFAHRVQLRLGRELPEAKRLLTEGLRLHPDDASLVGLKASVLEREGRPAEAEAALRRAAALSDDNPGFHLSLGAIDAKRDPSAAREHYLTAYFLDPRAGLDEPASTRIKELTFELGTERFDAEGKGCTEGDCYRRLVADSNPVFVTLALRLADLNWREHHVEPVVGLLSHDDPDLRAKAVSVLRRHVGEEFLPRLQELLRSQDLHVRGLSSFLAARLMGPESLPVLEAFLDSPAQAVRRDALRALASSGLEGSADLIAAHAERERHPALRAEARRLLTELAGRPGG